jgi:hypothetical protein
LNDTTLDFLAPPEHPKTPLPVGQRKYIEKAEVIEVPKEI